MFLENIRCICTYYIYKRLYSYIYIHMSTISQPAQLTEYVFLFMFFLFFLPFSILALGLLLAVKAKSEWGGVCRAYKESSQWFCCGQMDLTKRNTVCLVHCIQRIVGTSCGAHRRQSKWCTPAAMACTLRSLISTFRKIQIPMWSASAACWTWSLRTWELCRTSSSWSRTIVAANAKTRRFSNGHWSWRYFLW